MRVEKKKDVIDREEFCRLVIQRMNVRGKNATLNASLNFSEFLEIIGQLPIQEELSAVWILDGSIWRCSWCKMSALESFGKSFPSRCCPYCGRRMKMEGKL